MTTINLPELPEMDYVYRGGVGYTGSDMQEYATQAVEQALASQWRPIETAPKVTLSRGYCENILVVVGKDVFRARWWSHSDGASNFLDDGGNACYPSHWMPLPPAPTAIASQGEPK